jgi:uncharacterized protein (TIGR02246 family)
MTRTLSRGSRVTLGLLIATCSVALAAGPEQEIRGVLQTQTESWNRGDLDGFLTGYKHSADVVFVGRKIARGFDQLRERYRDAYGSQEKMGQLRFSDVQVQTLGPAYANVIGRFHLDRNQQNGGPAEGVFTLLFQKTGQGWKIIQDHTS